MEADKQGTLPEGSLLAALDLGSNSFHLIIAKIEHGEMRPVEVLAEKVQLGAGLGGSETSSGGDLMVPRYVFSGELCAF